MQLSITEEFIICYLQRRPIRALSTRAAAGVFAAALFDLEQAKIIRYIPIEKSQSAKTSSPSSQTGKTNRNQETKDPKEQKAQKEQVEITSSIPTELSYLQHLYNFLEARPGWETERLARQFTLLSLGKEVGQLLDDVAANLLNQHLATPNTNALFTYYRGLKVNADAVTSIIERLKAEICEPGVLSDEAMALAASLKSAKILPFYFSPFERSQIDTRLQECLDSPRGARIARLQRHVENSAKLILILAG